MSSKVNWLVCFLDCLSKGKKGSLCFIVEAHVVALSSDLEHRFFQVDRYILEGRRGAPDRHDRKLGKCVTCKHEVVRVGDCQWDVDAAGNHPRQIEPDIGFQQQSQDVAWNDLVTILALQFIFADVEVDNLAETRKNVSFPPVLSVQVPVDLAAADECVQISDRGAPSGENSEGIFSHILRRALIRRGHINNRKIYFLFQGSNLAPQSSTKLDLFSTAYSSSPLLSAICRKHIYYARIDAS